VAVGQLAGEQPTDAQAHHHQRVGQGRIGPAHAELGLHRRQHHRHHVHAAVAQRHQRQRGEQAAHGHGRVDQAGVGGCVRHDARCYAGPCCAFVARVAAVGESTSFDGVQTPCAGWSMLHAWSSSAPRRCSPQLMSN
jgi:hypothetical protein